MAREMERPFRMDQLARSCGLSPSRFAHLFREQMGRSPRAYAEDRRMERAVRLLRLTTLPVAEVAAACGFEDPLYFSSRFRRWTKSSPSAFRSR
jgi:AraC family transcriptional regulator of arabinose operon